MRGKGKILFMLAMIAAAQSYAADSWQHQGVVESNLPASWQQLKSQMTYPDSWLSGHNSDFHAWQQHTRQQLRQSLLTPDSHKPFATQIIASEDRGSYTAEKLALNITDDNRIAALMLTPKTPGPHPAIVLLHDHGSKFDIGKEKLIRPWGNAEQLASAQAWADKFFSGRFIGDELAKRGYTVIAIDSPGWGDRGPMVYEQQQALALHGFQHRINFAQIGHAKVAVGGGTGRVELAGDDASGFGAGDFLGGEVVGQVQRHQRLKRHACGHGGQDACFVGQCLRGGGHRRFEVGHDDGAGKLRSGVRHDSVHGSTIAHVQVPVVGAGEGQGLGGG